MHSVQLVFVVMVAFCVVRYEAAMTDSQRARISSKLLTTGLECIKDHPVKMEHINAFRSRTVPNDETAKCFIKCIYKNLGVMDDSGKLLEKNVKRAARQFFKEGDDTLMKVEELFKTCMPINDEETKDGEKGCDRAKLVFECFVKHAPKLGLDINV